MGGMQRVSLQLVKTLSAREDVELTTIGQETSWDYIELKTMRFLVDLYTRLPVLAARLKPDVLLFSSMVTAALAPVIRERVDVPMVTINHGHDVTMNMAPYQWYLPKVFRNLDGVISVSSATREACILRGMHADKGTALPNGFEADALTLSLPKSQAVQMLGEAAGKNLEGRPILLTTGRLVLRKGHEWFINEVLPRVKSPVEYVIIGDGPEMQSVVEATLNSTCRERIHLLGRQSDELLQAAYVAADLFVMPNIRVAGDMEGFGIVMLEANVAGTPVVASDLEGIRDVVRDGRNGYRIAPGEAGLFSEKIDDLLDGNLAELSESARNYVGSTFTWEQVSQRYLDYLKSVVVNYRLHQHNTW